MDILRCHPQQHLAGAAELTELLKDKPDHVLQSPIRIKTETDMPIPGVADRRGNPQFAALGLRSCRLIIIHSRADDPQLEGQTRFLGISDRRRHARIGDRDDDIGSDRTFAGEFAADPLARLVDALAFEHAVGPSEIDVLEDAEPLRRVVERLDAAHPAVGLQPTDLIRGADDNDFAGLDIAHEVGTDDVEGAGLRGDDP